MDQRQIQKTIRTLEGELKTLDLQRGTLTEALESLRRLLPPDPAATNGSRSKTQDANVVEFPGLTAGILSIIEEGQGRPVTVGAIREAFRRRGWLYADKGQDRSKTIYETMRRLNKAGRVEKLGKRGYVMPRQSLLERARESV